MRYLTVLREIRESKGYTIIEVSKGSKIPASTLYDVESGRKGLIFSRAKSIADFFEEPIEKLFFCNLLPGKVEINYFPPKYLYSYIVNEPCRKGTILLLFFKFLNLKFLIYIVSTYM